MTLVLGVAIAPAADARKLAVLPPQGGDSVDEVLAEFLALVIDDRAMASLPSDRWEVLSAPKIKAAMQSKNSEITSCQGDCELAVGRLLEADVIVTSIVIQLGVSYGVTLQAVDVASGRLIASAARLSVARDTLLADVMSAADALFVGSRERPVSYFRDDEAFVVLELQQHTITVTPDTQHGILSFNAMPWATVHIDGLLLGNTPIANVQVAPGRHEIRFVCPPINTEHTVQVDVALGEELSVVYQPDLY